MRQLLSMSLSQPIFFECVGTIPDGASGQLDMQVNGSSVGNLWIYHLTQHGSTLKVTTNMTVVDGSSARFRLMRHKSDSDTQGHPIEIW